MRKYESIIVFHPHLDSNGLMGEIEKLSNLITSNGGEDLQVDNWGKKEIAYQVGRVRNGYFVCLKFSTGNSAMPQKFAAALNINESVIKYQTHKINEKVRKFKGRPGRVARDLDTDDYASY
jgi:small subunit ribosomal protein S6